MTARQGRRATMADVARMANVSAATVSFVLNPKSGQHISQATRARVMQAVADLEYRPNRAARGLRRGITGTVGVLLDEPPSETFTAEILHGIHDAATRSGRVVLSAFTGRDPDLLLAAATQLLDHGVDGLIVGCAGTRAITTPTLLRSARTVLVNCRDEDASLPAFLPDDEAGGRAVARLAIDAGHTRIALLAGRKDAIATRLRVRGIEAELREAGISPVATLYGNYHIDSGDRLAQDALGLPDRPTVLLCGNDRMAMGALLALGRSGLRSPHDVSLIGYDDADPSVTMLTPALTTVRLPLYDLGFSAASALLDAEPLNDVTYLPCVPVRRESLTPPAVVETA